jgi:hypothetical protein
MFEQLDELIEKPKRKPMPRWLAVLGVAIGALNLGLVTGMLRRGARPSDWPIFVGQQVFMLFYTILCAISAVRRSD